MSDFTFFPGEWRFASAGAGGEPRGIADGGVEQYRGDRYRLLGREICQNSMDAVLDASKPVTVTFTRFNVTRSRIPRLDQLEEAFEKEEKTWADNDKTTRFFKNADSIARGVLVPVLQISDFNTTGLTGSDKSYGTPWSNLVRFTGASSKTGSAGGSYGLGKSAAFACSDFRTVFYSTLDEYGVKAHQGVARIPSYMEKKDGFYTQGTGFYGMDEANAPVEGQLVFGPSERESGQSGTDITIVAPAEDDDWETSVIASVLDGFLLAVYDGRLIVKVQDVTINKDNLPVLMGKYKESFTQSADEYYKVLCAPESEAATYRQDFEGMGEASLRILVSPDLHCRTVAMVRNTGMKVKDRKSISRSVQFAGVMRIEGEKLNAFLRSLENVQHTDWEADRPEDKADKRKAKRLDRELLGFIKECLDKQQKQNTGEEIDPAIGNFLPAQDEGNQDSRKEDITDAIQSVDVSTKPIPPSSAVRNTATNKQTDAFHEDDSDNPDMDEDSPGTGGGFRGGGGKTETPGGAKSGSGDGPNPTPKPVDLTPVVPDGQLIVCTNPAKGEYRVLYTPSAPVQDGCIKLSIVGETDSYDADIKAATDMDGNALPVSGNRISGLTFTPDAPLLILVTLGETGDYFNLEVMAYENRA